MYEDSYTPGLLLSTKPLTANPGGTAYLLEGWGRPRQNEKDKPDFLRIQLFLHTDGQQGVIKDELVCMRRWHTRRWYPAYIRRIEYKDETTGLYLTFLTNNLQLDAIIIAKLYKERWKVELFFKWIKQNLRIKKFYGTSENAVKTQIWIAVCDYLLIAIIKKRLNLEISLNKVMQILSVSLFEKCDIKELFYHPKTKEVSKLPSLFDGLTGQ